MNQEPNEKDKDLFDDFDSPFITDMREPKKEIKKEEPIKEQKKFVIEIPDDAELPPETRQEEEKEAPKFDESIFDDAYDISTFHFEEEQEEENGEVKGVFGKKKKKNKKDTKKDIKRRKIAKVLLTVFLIGVISTCVIVGGVAVYLLNFMDNSIGVDLDDLKLNFTTTVYVADDNGNYVEYQRVHGTENRLWISLDKIPDNMVKAAIAIEDERFYEHAGVDWKRAIAAAVNSVFHYSSSNFGGSTITQQLVKNLTGDRDKTKTRKVREMLRAIELEKIYSKDTIMECYLNTIPLGGSCYGIEVAAQYYYGKSASEMTLAECALMAGITNSPNNYRPDTHFDKGWERGKLVLKKMYETGSITEEEYNAALSEEIVITADKDALKETEINSWFVDTLITQVAEDMAEKYGYTVKEALSDIYNGGYKIYSTLQPKVQEALEKAAKNSDLFTIKDKNGNYPEIAMAVTDYQGHIVGCVGGAGEKDGNRLLDRAYTVTNQPGSAIKPIGVYDLAIEENIINYSTIVEDSPVAMYDGRAWPSNFYEGYTGNNTIAHAVARSINTVAVKVLQQVGISKSYQFLTEKLHFSHLNPGAEADESLSALAIGGTNGGVTPVEMAAAFSIFGNGGKYYLPKTYTKVTNQRGTEVLLEVEDNDYEQVISPETSEVMNQLLQGVVYGLDGTGWMMAGTAGSMQVFAKSGTSSDYYDNWLIAGSPYYSAAVWYGFDASESTGETYCAKFALRDIFKEIHQGLAYKSFPHYEDVIPASYCNISGDISLPSCYPQFTGYYKKEYMPSKCDGSHNGHIEVKVETDETSSEQNN